MYFSHKVYKFSICLEYGFKAITREAASDLECRWHQCHHEISTTDDAYCNYINHHPCIADLDLTETEVRCQVLNQFRCLTVKMKHATMIKKALLRRQLYAFWIFPRSQFAKYENKMLTFKLKKSKQASFPLQQLVHFHAILSLALINSVSDTAIEVMLCTLILNLAERESATTENVCNLQSFSTIFLQQRSISVKALGVGHQWL